LAEQKGIINTALAGIQNKTLWGALDVSVQDDSWTYKPNPEKSN